ncbi:MAG: hypothetical protein WCQ59_06470 [Candidatus Cloacimonadaceae bacterium]
MVKFCAAEICSGTKRRLADIPLRGLFMHLPDSKSTALIKLPGVGGYTAIAHNVDFVYSNALSRISL